MIIYNLCFRAKMRKVMNTPACYKSGGSSILGYPGAIHFVKLHSSMNVGYGMQCAWVTEDGVPGEGLNQMGMLA